MSRATACPLCGAPCKVAHLAQADVYICPRGHRPEQPRLFAGDSQGLQQDLFGPPAARIASTPLQQPLALFGLPQASYATGTVEALLDMDRDEADLRANMHVENAE